MLFENEISKNLHRRHLDESQRAMVGANVKKLLEAEAKERQKQAGGDRKTVKGKMRGALPVDLPEALPGDSRDIAGASVNVSGTSVQRAIKVLKLGSDELIQAVDQGVIKLGTAEKLDHDINFQVECLDWLEGFRGAEFIDELERLIVDHGPDEALRQTFHPDQCDQTRECYRAAIDYLSNLLAPQTG